MLDAPSGRMTGVMRIVQPRVSPRLLRVAIAQGGRIVDERLIKHREDVTVGACHARAKAKNVDTSPKSSGGAVPLTEDRPVTSGDIMGMFQAHAERRAREMAEAD